MFLWLNFICSVPHALRICHWVSSGPWGLCPDSRNWPQLTIFLIISLYHIGAMGRSILMWWLWVISHIRKIQEFEYSLLIMYKSILTSLFSGSIISHAFFYLRKDKSTTFDLILWWVWEPFLMQSFSMTESISSECF